MKVLIIADIHGNVEALKAVIEDGCSYDIVICLGDIVGYGPEPNECIKIVKKICKYIIAGNHEFGVIGKEDISKYNKDAQFSIEYTKTNIAQENFQFINGLNVHMVFKQFEIVHGALTDPINDYILNTGIAHINFDLLKTGLCFFGHTHRPVIYYQDKKKNVDYQILKSEKILKLDMKHYKYLINPGSVGQPRDRNPLASYMIYDTEEKTINYRRVYYDINAVQKKMEKLNFPERLIERLSEGK